MASIRSLLFVPGARPERFSKALDAGADAVCIDLEDAVPPPQKEGARATTLAWLETESTHGTPAIGLRTNALRTAEGMADLAALKASGVVPAFVMLPKPAHREDIAIVAEVLGPSIPLIPILESGAALRHAWEIAAAPQVVAVLFGGVDFSADLGAELSWEPMLHARGTLAAACAAAGAQLLDVPYLDVQDEAGLVESTRRAKAMGFTGRACIHPAQVAGVNTAFTPTEAEIAHARAVMDAFEAAQGGAALLNGKLIELPVIRAATRVLDRARG